MVTFLMRNCTFGQVPAMWKGPDCKEVAPKYLVEVGAHTLGKATCCKQIVRFTFTIIIPSRIGSSSHPHLSSNIKTFQRFHVLTNWMPWGFCMVQNSGNWVWGNWREEFEGASPVDNACNKSKAFGIPNLVCVEMVMETSHVFALQSCMSVWRITEKLWQSRLRQLKVGGGGGNSVKIVDGTIRMQFGGEGAAEHVPAVRSRGVARCYVRPSLHHSQGAAEVVHWPAKWQIRKCKRGVHTEAWLARRNEEGSWQYSPEWWGTQGGGWGRDAGEVVFEACSSKGNGFVSVTTHSASTPRSEDWAAVERELERRQKQDGRANNWVEGRFRVLGYEWRVLRFNDVTRQSVAKVIAVVNDKSPSQVFLVQQPNCIAFEYVKSMISVGLSTMNLVGLNLEQVASRRKQIRILCIGLGGGSLPLFLAHNLPGAKVDIVEIDGAVIRAAIESMGFPPCLTRSSHFKVPALSSLAVGRSDLGEYEELHGGTKADKYSGQEHEASEEVLYGSTLRSMTLYEADGEAYVVELEQQESRRKPSLRQYYDVVFVDAYDGDDMVPTNLWARNGPFLTSLNQLLHPKHGTAVINLHTDAPPPSLLEKATGQYGPGFNPSLPQGRRVQEACWSYRDALLSSSTGTGPVGGVAFTVAVPSQGNISLVVSRGLSVNNTLSSRTEKRCTQEEQNVVDKLKRESKSLQKVLNSQIDFSKRVSRGFQIVQDRVKDRQKSLM